MFRPLSVWIGLRYLRARKRGYFISFISSISILGIAIGVLVLITVVAVMNGFEKEVRRGILGVVSHATLSGMYGPLKNWEAIAEAATAHPEVLAVAPYVHGGAMVGQGRSVSGVLVRGILPEAEAKISSLKGELFSALTPDGQGILLGRALAERLGIHLGEQIKLMTARSDHQGTVPVFSRYTVVGLFDLGIRQYDTSLVFLHLLDATRLFGLENAVTGLRLKVTDLYQANRVANEIAQALPDAIHVSDWTRQNPNFFVALAQQRQMMFILLGLIVAVAAFNVVSTLVLVVTEKASSIAILRTLGMSPAEIMAIFVVQGGSIGWIGVLAGAIGGVTLALHVQPLVAMIEAYFGIQFLASEAYPISWVPSDLRWEDVAFISGTALGLSFLATLYPAWRAAATRPAEVLRHT